MKEITEGKTKGSGGKGPPTHPRPVGPPMPAVIKDKEHPYVKLKYESHGESFEIGGEVTNYIEIGCGLETINLEITKESFEEFNNWLIDLHKDYTKEKK